jgi:hypothetical protein
MNKRRRKRRSPRSKAQFVEQDGALQLPPTLSPVQLAGILGVSRQHVTQACVRGEIRAQRLGVLWIIPRPEAERLMGTELRRLPAAE